MYGIRRLTETKSKSINAQFLYIIAAVKNRVLNSCKLKKIRGEDDENIDSKTWRPGLQY